MRRVCDKFNPLVRAGLALPRRAWLRSGANTGLETQDEGQIVASVVRNRAPKSAQVRPLSVRRGAGPTSSVQCSRPSIITRPGRDSNRTTDARSSPDGPKSRMSMVLPLAAVLSREYNDRLKTPEPSLLRQTAGVTAFPDRRCPAPETGSSPWTDRHRPDGGRGGLTSVFR